MKSEYAHMADQNDETPPSPPKKRRGRPPGSPDKLLYRRTGSHGSNVIRRFPGEKVALKEVDMDLMFRRAMQFAEWMMDRMEQEVDGSELFTGVPMKFPQYMRELSSALNTLSLSHARWLKANEEMYERLSDDEKLAALGKWIPALYLRHPEIVKDWMRNVALTIQSADKSKLSSTAPPITKSVVEEVTGPLPRKPEWKEVAAQVRREFIEKREKRFGPRVKEPSERAALDVWSQRNKTPDADPSPEVADGSDPDADTDN